MLLNEGTLEGVRIFTPETVKLMTSVQTPESTGVRRGLGWDIDSGYSGPRGKLFPLGSFGHTGWTGTSIWLDPFSDSFVIFLSNRNHPDEKGNVGALRSRLGTLAAEAIADYNLAYVPGALAAQARGAPATDPSCSGKPQAEPNHDAQWHRCSGESPVRSTERFASWLDNQSYWPRSRAKPQHRFVEKCSRCPIARFIQSGTRHSGSHGRKNWRQVPDEQTGLPVFSLYGEVRKPTPEQLKDLDALVFDIQDVGCRFYTYISTMGLTLEAAAENGKKYFVLDRINPITGALVEGPVRQGSNSFVAFHNIPLRYGMTIGELACMFNVERGYNADLTVIKLENWQRDLWLDETGLPWTNPSPNMRSLVQAILYPGVGLLESAVSVGRGTDTPFEVIGAPYINDVQLAGELNAAALPGVRFVPIRFTPTASVHKGELCAGVNIILTDRERCNVVDVGILLAMTLQRLYPEKFDLNKIQHLLLHEPTLQAIKAGKGLSEIRALWQPDFDEFQKRRAKYLLY